MSFFKNKRALAKVSFERFEGIDRRRPADGSPETDILVNLRILADGSLKKRSGYKMLAQVPERVRAILTGNFDGSYLGYVLSGYTVYKIDLSNGSLLKVGTIGTETGRASIFYYLGHVYICDGEELYDVKDDGIYGCEGYAPLLGKDWGSVFPGEINEPLNALCRRARISYVVSDPPNSFLSTMYVPKRVDALYRNGELVDPSEYTLDREFKVISMPGLEASDRILVYLTFADDESHRRRLAKNTEAAIFGGISNSRVFMWGGEDKNRLFTSGAVSEESLRESEAIYKDTGGLYFPIGYDFSVGDGRSEIRAVSRHYGRLIVFTAEDTWMADSESCGVDAYPAMRINSFGGCSSHGAVARIRNDPLSVSERAVLRWTANTDTFDECNAYSISDGIADILPDSFFENAVVFEDRRNGEVLFADRSDGDGTVYVYGSNTESWYTYNGINADRFFETAKGVGFVNGSVLYVFDESLDRDIERDGIERAIEGYFVSRPMDFGLCEDKKRLMEVCAVADIEKGNIKVSFESDSGVGYERSVTRGDYASLATYRFRANCGRFIRTVMRLELDADSLARIYSIDLISKR